MAAMAPGRDDPIKYRQLARDELELRLTWAAAEGWDPGVSDAETFWATDPNAFFGAYSGGELLAGCSTLRYPPLTGGQPMGFIGLLIVRPDQRGRGIGGDFFGYLHELLRTLVGPDGPIALDGVTAMQPFYAAQGFRRQHDDIRMSGIPEIGHLDSAVDVLQLMDVSFQELCAFDARCFGADRRTLLDHWIRSPNFGVAAKGAEGRLAGYGVIRPTVGGHKVGPLFAEDATIAATIFAALVSHRGVGAISLDVPDAHSEALELARSVGLTETFRCAYMVSGPIPQMRWDQVFGVTTLEIG